ncbi:MAG: stage II sporulation protein M [Candidatus Woesearchaeota archaeon]
MVLESLITPKGAEKRPMIVFLLGMLYSSIALFLGAWIFKEEASLIVVFLTVLACVPLMYKIIKYEEKRDDTEDEEGVIMKGHFKALEAFMALFMGCVVSFSLWFILLPPSTVSNLFATQMNTINIINNPIAGSVTQWQMLTSIFSNNFKVLFFCVFFSFFYGAGAIFILTWNASVISAAIGSYIRSNLGAFALHTGFTKIAAYFQVFSVGLLRYMTHGAFEILAYFIGGLAGGLISVAVVNHDIKDEQFGKVLKDAGILIVLAIAVILFAGVVETYVTPALF